MSAQYHAPKIETSGLTLRAGFDIENTSGESWSGLSIGYHIFDPETDTLVVDGARTRLDQDRTHLDMSFDEALRATGRQIRKTNKKGEEPEEQASVTNYLPNHRFHRKRHTENRDTRQRRRDNILRSCVAAHGR